MIPKVRPRIAIVEDDEAVSDSICLVLDAVGLSAREYATGEAFLAAFDAGECFSAVILDPHLPGKNGAQIAHELTMQSPSLPILGITAKPNSPLAHAMSRAGARVMLTKPVSAESLVSQLQEMMD